MKIKEIMTPMPEFVTPDTSIKKAAETMKKNDCGAIPVCDGERLGGMITDRDIAIRAVAEGKEPDKTLVKDVMTKEIHYCFEDQNIDEASKIMSDKQIRRLVVLDKDKKMVGIISLGDIATKCESQKLVADVTESVSTPESEQQLKKAS